MMLWLAHNIGTVIVTLVLAAAVTFVIVKTVKDKKRGASSCSCGCGGCSLKDHCHPKR